MRTWIELSSSAFYHNISQLVSLLPSSTTVGLVVKSNAYGHGIVAISCLAETDDRIGWLCTAGIQEACTLRKEGIKKPILAMAYEDDSLTLAIEQAIALTVYDTVSAYRVMRAARSVGKKALVHIKIDTGLARLGILPYDIFPVVRMLYADPFIYLQGIFTHLADPNNQDLTYTYGQLSLFEDVVTALQHEGIVIPLVHALSSGALLLSTFSHDLVRIGTNAYGFWKSPIQKSRFLNHKSTFDLEPVLSWFSCVQKVIKKDSLAIAYVPIGYGDGYPKLLEGRAYVLLQDYQAMVIYVHEDYLALDVSTLPIKPGCSVLLMGGSHATNITHLAYSMGTINNEIATGINPEIPRIVSF